LRAYIVIGAFAVLAASARIYGAKTEDRTSAGLNCTVDCSDYDAGYKWPEQRGIDDEDYCPDGDKFFYEGCVAYVADLNGTHYEADNGIGTPLPLSPDDGDDDDDN
jgi:hypothetical protein